MPAVRGDGMRGLAVFISDIRNCKSKEAEVKRINKELANIRSKFKVSKFKPIKSSIYKFIQNKSFKLIYVQQIFCCRETKP